MHAWRHVLFGGLLGLAAACGGGGGAPPSDGGEAPSLPPVLCDDTPLVCGELVPFEPDLGEGYFDQLLPGETEEDERYDYVRRDVMLALRYAAAKVARVAAGWTPGNGGPLGIGYMSESDGGTPLNDGGELLFPAGTHENGLDATVAYYQFGTADNALRAVCPHDDMGVDVFHCTAAPDALDARRTALFIAALAEHPQLRVIGVDPLIGPVLEAALDDLVAEGVVDMATRASVPLAYSSPAWALFFHHAMYVSFNAP